MNGSAPSAPGMFPDPQATARSATSAPPALATADHRQPDPAPTGPAARLRPRRPRERPAPPWSLITRGPELEPAVRSLELHTDAHGGRWRDPDQTCHAEAIPASLSCRRQGRPRPPAHVAIPPPARLIDRTAKPEDPSGTGLSALDTSLTTRTRTTARSRRRYTGDLVKRMMHSAGHDVGSPKSSSPSLAPRRNTNRRRSAQRVSVL